MNKKEKNNGYAILFTVVVVSIISMITIGLANTTYKQLILSSLAKDSTTAFYQADMGTECALYADTNSKLGSSYSSFNCDGQTLGITPQAPQPPKNSWIISPQPTPSSGPCFDISVIQTASGLSLDRISTQVLSNGYNICDKNNSRIVQRTIEVNY